MKNLIIIGAGGCGRELLQWARDINQKSQRWNIKGFLDDNLEALEGKKCSVKVISKIDDYVIGEDDEFVCGIGNSAIRKLVTEKMRAKGAHFITLIHPTAVVAETATLAEGVILYPFSLISDNAVVGDSTIVNMYSSIAHDSVVGPFCTISAHCDVTGECTLGEGVFMGTTSNMVPSTKVGDGAYICAGSTVMGRVRPGKKVLGVPAKIINL